MTPFQSIAAMSSLVGNCAHLAEAMRDLAEDGRVCPEGLAEALHAMLLDASEQLSLLSVATLQWQTRDAE